MKTDYKGRGRWLSRAICGLIALLLCCGALAMPVFAGEEHVFCDTSRFTGKRIGVQTGSTSIDVVFDVIKDPQVMYFTTTTDAVTALQAGKIDAFVNDEPNTSYLASDAKNIRVELVDTAFMDAAMAFRKDENGKVILDQFNAFLRELTDSGELARLQRKWIDGPEQVRLPELNGDDLPNVNGVLKIATDPTFPPFDYIKDGTVVGYDLDIMYMFCKAYGYQPELQTADFAGVISALTTGKCDVVAAGMNVTEERKQAFNFSDSVYEVGTAIAYPDDSTVGSTSFLSSIGESFQKTFIVDGRWREFLGGALVTLEITIISILGGTLIGFLLHLICRRGNRIANAVSAALRWLLHGMPMVVLLMILFYIIFGSSQISAVWVAIIGFGMIFACFTHELMQSGESTVDPGQMRAAEALGYTNLQAYFRIILPQTIRYMLPAYLTEITSQIKGTAVVGYIAVTDITKVGDLVRSRTYDAFFPLIAVAVAYFLMAGILRCLVRILARGTDPKRRSEANILGKAVIK